MRCLESGSWTRNLSFGLRPVCGEVTAANGPLFVTIPSRRRRACSYSWDGVRFRCRRCSVDIPMGYLVDRARRRCSRASTAAITAIFTMSGTSDNLCRTWTGRSIPTRMGPMASACARRRRELGQGLGVGLDVHGRVGEEEGLLAEDHHVDAADVLAAGLHADDLERRANRVGIVDFLAGYERVGATRSQQQQAVVNRV